MMCEFFDVEIVDICSELMLMMNYCSVLLYWVCMCL